MSIIPPSYFVALAERVWPFLHQEDGDCDNPEDNLCIPLIYQIVWAHLALAVDTGQRVNIAGTPLATACQFARTQGGVTTPTSSLLGLGLGGGGQGITDGWCGCLNCHGFIRGSRDIRVGGLQGMIISLHWFSFNHRICVSLWGLIWFLFDGQSLG